MQLYAIANEWHAMYSFLSLLSHHNLGCFTLHCILARGSAKSLLARDDPNEDAGGVVLIARPRERARSSCAKEPAT